MDVMHLESIIITTTIHIVSIVIAMTISDTITTTIVSTVIVKIINITIRFCHSDPNSDSDASVNDMCDNLTVSKENNRHLKVAVEDIKGGVD